MLELRMLLDWYDCLLYRILKTLLTSGADNVRQVISGLRLESW